MSLSGLFLLLLGTVHGSLIPEAMLGAWSGDVTTSPLGPMKHGKDFLLFSSQGTDGDFYMRHSYDAQLFRIRNNVVEYCFSYDDPNIHTAGADFAPFQVVPSSDANELNLCWRGPRLPSHKTNCTGCECAHFTLQVDGDTLHSVFRQSPPAIHMNATLTRTGPPPSAEIVRGGWNCTFRGNYSGHPNRTTVAASSSYMKSHLFQEHPQIADTVLTPDASGQVKNCLVLNPIHNVRLEYVADTVPCMPCNVTFTVSADTPLSSLTSSYVAIGFKERYAAYHDWDQQKMDIPNYWGMSTSYDNATDIAGRIVAGYTTPTGTSCVRLMKANAYVGSLVEVPDDGKFWGLRATQNAGGTSVQFTTAIHAGKDLKDINWWVGDFGYQRVMWAIGDVGEGTTCQAPLRYHFGKRAQASLNFPGYGSPCHTPGFMLSTDMTMVV